MKNTRLAKTFASLTFTLSACIAIALAGCSDNKETEVSERAAKDAQVRATLLAKKTELLKNFSRTGDQFKHPTIYLHKELEKGDSTRSKLSATSKGDLHMHMPLRGLVNIGIYVAMDEQVFYISFENRDGPDLNEGGYSSATMPAEKRPNYKDIRELTSFVLSDFGKAAKNISLKSSYSKSIYSVDTVEQVEVLTNEEIEAFRQTIQLADVLGKINALLDNTQATGKQKNTPTAHPVSR